MADFNCRPITFRPARPEEAETIAAYHRRCWLEAFALLMEPDAVAGMAADFNLAKWRLWLDPGSEPQTVVADLDGIPIGHTTVASNEILHVFVHPDHWRTGLGRSLLAIGEDLLAQAGHGEIELHTIVGNEPALTLYRSTGWIVTDRTIDNDNHGVTYTEHVLTKQLHAGPEETT